MKKRSDIEKAVRSGTAILLLPLVAFVSSGPAFAAQSQTTPAPAPTAATSKAAAASAAGAPAATKFSTDQLEQMVAPVALYPDPLLMQIFMASTFPIEIVQAARFMENNSGLKGSALDEALKKQSWDASVKSMCSVPDVLKRLNENLDWTQDLGEAILAQKTELLDAVQRMRGKAYESGNLKTTEQQTVTQQPDKIIVIQPSNPEVIYVPQYSSTVVYGSAWAYPTYYYPPAYYAPVGYGAMAFTAGMFMGAAIWGGASWGWGHGDVDIDVNRQNNFNRNTDASFKGGDRGQGNRGQSAGNKAGGKQSWNRSQSNSSRAQSRGAGVSNNQARGYGSNSGARGQGASASTRSSGGSRGASASPSTRSAGGGGSYGSSRSSGSYGGSSRGSSGSSAWSGSRGGSSSARSSSSRGSMSRGGGGRGGRR